MTKKDRAKELVRLAVLESQDYKCANCRKKHGTLGDSIEVHHIGGRNNSTNFTPLAQIGLCDECHRGKEEAPHVSVTQFLQWLQEKYPIKYRYYQENKNKIVNNRDINFDEIIESMEAQLNVNVVV